MERAVEGLATTPTNPLALSATNALVTLSTAMAEAIAEKPTTKSPAQPQPVSAEELELAEITRGVVSTLLRMKDSPVPTITSAPSTTFATMENALVLLSLSTALPLSAVLPVLATRPQANALSGSLLLMAPLAMMAIPAPCRTPADPALALALL
jgi:hypothetical protein